MVGTRGNRTFNKPLGITAGAREEERRWTRWVTDLRELNKQTVKDSYPLTNIQEILHSLQGAPVFSSLDACEAYHAVRIKPGSRACTAFIWYIPVHQDAFWIDQRWKRVQQNAGRGHEEHGQGFLDLLPR